MARFIATCVGGTAGVTSLVGCVPLKAGDQVVSIVSDALPDVDLTPSFGQFIPHDGQIAWLGLAVGAGQTCLIMVERPGT